MTEYTSSPEACQAFVPKAPERSEKPSGDGCAASVPEGASLPCQSSNNSIELLLSRFNYARKQAHCLRENIERFIREIGVEHIVFLTLTFPDNLRDSKRAYARFRSFNSNFLKQSPLFGDWYCVKERQQRGAWHYHLLVQVFQDVRSGFNWEEFQAKNYRSASPHLREIWSTLREVLPRYGFGRHEVTPIRKDGEIMSKYMAKYLFKNFQFRQPGDKGVRLYSSSRSMVSSTPKFMWLTEKSRTWRKNVKLLCNWILQEDDYYAIADYYGTKWAYHLRQEILDLGERARDFDKF